MAGNDAQLFADVLLFDCSSPGTYPDRERIQYPRMVAASSCPEPGVNGNHGCLALWSIVLIFPVFVFHLFLLHGHVFVVASNLLD